LSAGSIIGQWAIVLQLLGMQQQQTLQLSVHLSRDQAQTKRDKESRVGEMSEDHHADPIIEENMI
jgi:hypothetical protein